MKLFNSCISWRSDFLCAWARKVHIYFKSDKVNTIVWLNHPNMNQWFLRLKKETNSQSNFINVVLDTQNQGKSERQKEISMAFINLPTTRGSIFFFIMGNKLNSIRKEKREDANLILRERKNLVKITAERTVFANKWWIASVTHILYYSITSRLKCSSLLYLCTPLKWKRKRKINHTSYIVHEGNFMGFIFLKLSCICRN